MIEGPFDELAIAGQLPTSHGIGLRLLRCLAGAEDHAGHCLDAVRLDPALAGRLLALACREGGREPGEVTDLCTAAAALPPGELCRLAMGFSLVAEASDRCRSFDYGAYWSRSLVTALLAQGLARDSAEIAPGTAYALGLLSHVGELALATVHPHDYADLIEKHGEGPTEARLRLEGETFGIDSRRVTQVLLRDWGCPEEWSFAVRDAGAGRGHEPDSEGEVARLAWVLDAAQQGAALLEAGASTAPDGDAWRRLVTTTGPLGLDAAACERWLERGRAEWELERTVYDEPPQVGVDAPATAAAHVEASLRVLVIDDDVHLTKLMAHHLTSSGHRVSVAYDGHEGLRRAVFERPQMIVTDWAMPGLDGLDMCRALRRTQSGRRTYILLLTAREDEERIIEAFEAGTDDYVTKPCHPKVLLARVQAARRLIDLRAQFELDRMQRNEQVAEMALMTRKLRAAALTDLVTGLPNRRNAMQCLDNSWDRAERRRLPLSIVMIDVDHFKQVNDDYGHDVGDQVLAAIADALRSNTRRGDVISRWGGEEFLVICPNTDGRTARACAERLRTAVEQRLIPVDGGAVRVTVSLGISERTTRVHSVDELIREADRAVYGAEAAGRNLVVGPLPWPEARATA